MWTVGSRSIDTGRIEPADQQRLLAAFDRVGEANPSLFEGVGLGLPLSQALAVMIAARITFESVSGQGSTFALEVTEPAG